MEEALHDVPAFRDFAALSHWDEHIPSESSILRFRHLLERHKLTDQIFATVNALLQAKGLQLKAGTAVDATLIAAPTSTKNEGKARDPQMHQSKKRNQWHFGMKAHIGVDADSGLVHTVRGTFGNVNDVIEANGLLHGQETDAFPDAGYQGVDKRSDADKKVRLYVAMRPGLHHALDREKPRDALIDRLERTKASIRAKVEQQFGYVKVRYRGLKKNTAQLVTLFALSNLWMARHKLLACMGQVPHRRASTPRSNTLPLPLPQPRNHIHRHLIPIGLVQDFMPRLRLPLDRHIGHTRIPVPLPQLLQKNPACGQRVCVARCDEDGQVAADARELRGIGQPGRGCEE